jgi:hypothetical protein
MALLIKLAQESSPQHFCEYVAQFINDFILEETVESRNYYNILVANPVELYERELAISGFAEFGHLYDEFRNDDHNGQLNAILPRRSGGAEA